MQVHDPVADAAMAAQNYQIELKSEGDLAPADAVVLAVAHDFYSKAGWPMISRLLKDGRGLVMDVKGILDPRIRDLNVEIWRL